MALNTCFLRECLENLDSWFLLNIISLFLFWYSLSEMEWLLLDQTLSLLKLSSTLVQLSSIGWSIKRVKSVGCRRRHLPSAGLLTMGVPKHYDSAYFRMLKSRRTLLGVTSSWPHSEQHQLCRLSRCRLFMMRGSMPAFLKFCLLCLPFYADSEEGLTFGSYFAIEVVSDQLVRQVESFGLFAAVPPALSVSVVHGEWLHAFGKRLEPNCEQNDLLLVSVDVVQQSDEVVYWQH